MFGEQPPHIRRRHPAPSVPQLGSLDDIVLPSAPAYVEVLSPVGDVREAVLDNSALLDNLTNKALARLDEVLSDPLSDDPKEMAVQMDAVRLVMTTQLRVDDSRLKRKESDTLSKLLARLEEEDVRLMKTVSA